MRARIWAQGWIIRYRNNSQNRRLIKSPYPFITYTSTARVYSAPGCNNVGIDKKSFEIMLELTPHIVRPKRRLEQYETPPSIAAHILWAAYMRGDIEDRDVADLGCGGLRLSLGALILGARRIVAVDVDDELLEYDEEYIRGNGVHKITLIYADVSDVYLRNIDTVIMNPPFGVVKTNRGMDIVFLQKALEIASSIYTIHKYSPGLERITREIVEENDAEIVWRELLDFPIPAMYETHRRKIYRVKTVFYIIKKNPR